MNFTYKVLPERRAIVARYTGAFTLGELIQSAHLMWSDPKYSREFDGIVDVSSASASVAVGDLRAFLKFLREEGQISRGRWATVATTPLATACSFMYRTAMSGHHTLEVFSTWEAARDFLNLGRGQDIAPLDEDLRTLLG